MRAVGKALIGKNRLIDLDYINKIYVSPRKRAQTTLKLLLESQEEHHPVEELNIITVSVFTTPTIFFSIPGFSIGLSLFLLFLSFEKARCISGKSLHLLTLFTVVPSVT